MKSLKIFESRYNPDSDTAKEMQLLILTTHAPVQISKYLQDVKVRLFKAKDEGLAKLVLAVHAPLAGRLNLQSLKKELENEAFKILHPKQYDLAVKLLRRSQADREKEVIDFIDKIKELLYVENIAVHDIQGRIKQPYSLYRKLNKTGTIADIHDLLAVRIITADKEACYRVLDVLHSQLKPNLSRFKDYIEQPKPNGYQSLHTTLKTGKKTIEVQIRTKEMDDEAEKGLAAHWQYDQHKSSKHYQKRSATSHDQDDSASSYIYVFSPAGDLYKLPESSSPLDFAFAVHTSIGLRTQGAKVDGKIVKLSRHLQNGEQVEIITGAKAAPKHDWLELAKSSKAISRIKTWLKQAERERYHDIGKQKLLDEFKGEIPKDIQTVLQRHKLTENEDLFVAIGAGYIHIDTVKRLLQRDEKPTPKPRTRAIRANKPSGGVLIAGMSGLQYRLAKCCNPKPECKITGYITRSLGISVHRADCSHITTEPERLLEANWR